MATVTSANLIAAIARAEFLWDYAPDYSVEIRVNRSPDSPWARIGFVAGSEPTWDDGNGAQPLSYYGITPTAAGIVRAFREHAAAALATK